MSCKKNSRRSNGEGTIYYDNKRSRWMAQATYINIAGEKQRKSFTGKTKKEAIQKKNMFLEKNARGEIAVKSKLTIIDLLSPLYENERKLNKIQDSGYERKQANLKIIANSTLGSIPISQIRDYDLIYFFQYITKYSNSVISKIYQMLTKGFDIACGRRIIISNPLNQQDRPELSKPVSNKANKEIRALTIEEQNLFLNALNDAKVENHRNNYKLQLLIELYTGMRMGEINALKKDDIDFENNVIHVRRTISRGIDYSLYINDKPKTNAGIRDIQMNQFSRKYLKFALEQYIDNKDELIFYDHINNKLISTPQVNSWMRRICKNAGIECCGQHMLRHTFATRCMEAGVRPEVLMKWLGHTDIKITINRYCDIQSKFRELAAGDVESYFENNLLNIL